MSESLLLILIAIPVTAIVGHLALRLILKIFHTFPQYFGSKATDLEEPQTVSHVVTSSGVGSVSTEFTAVRQKRFHIPITVQKTDLPVRIQELKTRVADLPEHESLLETINTLVEATQEDVRKKKVAESPKHVPAQS